LIPLVGREGEVDRVIQILCRRTKNNPVLIGEPGVGKTAIVEGLAQRIADGEVPSFLADKRILACSTSRSSSPAPNTAASSKSASRPS
jgi:ATP-dependent Clp protease ATP-binding subunit ClpC